MPPPAWRIGDDEEIVAELLVDAHQARWALDALGAEAVKLRHADGSVAFASETKALLRLPELSRELRRGEVAPTVERRQDRVLGHGQAGRTEVGVEPVPDRVLGPPQLHQKIRLGGNIRAVHRG